MSHRRLILRQTGATLVALGLSAASRSDMGKAPAVPTAASRQSLYQLKIPLTDQSGAAAWWGEFGEAVRPAGKKEAHPRLVGMFYTRCDMVCPMLFESIRMMEATLPEVSRQRLRVSLITLDPERDDVASLKKTADQRGGEPERWRLYRSDPRDVRKIAALLGVQYRRLDSGDFSHSAPVILLDGQGVEVGRTDQITRPDPAFLKLLAKVADNPT